MITELFRRTSSDRRSSHGSDTKLHTLGHGYKYNNRNVGDNKTVQDPVESARTKNAVYAALVLEEFLKELAAISQEHAVFVQNST